MTQLSESLSKLLDPSVVSQSAEHLYSLDHLRLVTCSGDDASNFLHGQLTNDIAGLRVGSVQLNAYLNPKGRVITTLYVCRLEETEFGLILPASLLEAVVKRLNMYKLRAKVLFEVSPLPCTGALSADALPKGIEPIGSMTATAMGDGTTLVNLGRDEDLFALFQNCPEGAERHPSAPWLATRYLQGVVEISADSTEKHLAQAINLDCVDGVNFRKGCYPGQEIVARLRYLGKLKQRSLCFVTADSAGLQVDSDLLAETKKVGKVVNVCNVGDKQVGIASCQYIDLDWEHVETDSGCKLTLMHPPYAIPELDQSDG